MSRRTAVMPEPQAALVERVRARLADEPTREVAMFGGRAFMVRGAMAVSAWRDGSLLVRVADDAGPALQQRPGAAQALMGERDMGPGWLTVDAEALADEPALTTWIGIALDHNRTVTGDP
ncbi:TfoX/Sxy family protein [Agrococcus baldri]|uniref:TfoX N-terminal domain-containing protein n=1 Tax=Agrococcus baldri TaxID=153730 RepID=A0AA87RF05_9MICO|nr:TfoX/Sxy family protein [Agrococcus baldri]GEK79270.1 hypothetical protein ABA31_06210 [Agrococcus baldri]